MFFGYESTLNKPNLKKISQIAEVPEKYLSVKTLGVIKHSIMHFRYTLKVCLVQVPSTKNQITSPDSSKWFTAKEIEETSINAFVTKIWSEIKK